MARKKFRNFTVGAILFLSLVAIVITGFGTGGGGLGDVGGGGSPSGTQLATVGGRPITADQANNQLNREFQNFQQQAGGLANAQMGEFLAQGGFEGSVERLIQLEALRQFAAGRGIVATRKMIDDAIYNAEDFRFARIGDRFDNNLFQQRLQAAGYTVEQVRQDIGQQLIQRQVLAPVIAGFAMPRGVGQAYATVPLEQRTGTIGVVPVGAIERGLNPTDAEVAAYYQRYRDHFAIPERRVVKYALIGAEQVSIVAPTDAEIRDVYGNTPRYQAGQIRTLESINFGSSGSSQADANAFAQRVRGGASFQQAAQAAGRGEAYVRRPNQTQQQFTSLVPRDVAAQAFSAQQGAIIGPVKSGPNWYVVRVETASGGRPLEAVRADIVREIERRKRAVAIAALATQIETQVEDGANFEAAATAARLTIVTTPAITAQGRLSNGRPWADLSADLRALLPAAFDLDPDNSDPQIATIQEGVRYAMVGVERIEAAAPPPLAEIRDLVRGQLIRRTADVRAYRIAQAIAARINGGMPAAQAFAQAGLPLPPPETINARRGNIMTRQAPESLQLFFRLRPGTAGVVAAPNRGGWMVAAPTQSVRAATAPAEIAESIRTQFGQAVPGEAEWQLLKSMEARIGVQRNGNAIRAERRRIAATMGAPTP